MSTEHIACTTCPIFEADCKKVSRKLKISSIANKTFKGFVSESTNLPQKMQRVHVLKSS